MSLLDDPLVQKYFGVYKREVKTWPVPSGHVNYGWEATLDRPATALRLIEEGGKAVGIGDVYLVVKDSAGDVITETSRTQIKLPIRFGLFRPPQEHQPKKVDPVESKLMSLRVQSSPIAWSQVSDLVDLVRKQERNK